MLHPIYFPPTTTLQVGSEIPQGVVLESTFCGSYSPGALPPEEPPQAGCKKKKLRNPTVRRCDPCGHCRT